jgi:hypothetical protein
MSPNRGSIACATALLIASALGLAQGDATGHKVWNFTMTPVESVPQGFRIATGEWRVVDDAGNRVLAQEAKNPDEIFNVVLVEGTSYKDVELSVRLKAVHGALDRGGGLVWRARDARNYYIARFNPLENNFRVYKVVDGKRTLFKSADVTLSPGWHALRVTMTGGSIKCELDGKPYLDLTDDTFKDAGMIGLWSKSDAQTFFDDLSVREHDSKR